ncbi:pyridoxamine 5'-phosphate oxidase family protein [Halovenus rubra]|uniref:Pyridoxamine 5'-phosphate oxidase family protein n=2 Tax=Halovenus rubra TaxID=869890 RepID=A0ABD5X1H4_9EURY|nr:pyridoxamine 5'-phosphate oxidase family protein [Halovenus rubra]
MTINELKRYGLEEMREEEIETFLETQSFGVLGLPGKRAPYLVPLSYAFGGNSSLYFTYVLGEESKKEQLTDSADRARYLIYNAETMFNWESVLLEGTFKTVPPSEWADIADELEGVWRPEIFKTAGTSRNVKIFEFEIVDSSGIKHTQFPSEHK